MKTRAKNKKLFTVYVQAPFGDTGFFTIRAADMKIRELGPLSNNGEYKAFSSVILDFGNEVEVEAYDVELVLVNDGEPGSEDTVVLNPGPYRPFQGNSTRMEGENTVAVR